MNISVMQAELALDDILRDQDELLDKARGFGMRTAAIPRGLMPLREAQNIVTQFDANTKKLNTFLGVMRNAVRDAPDKESKDALASILARAENSLRKFEADLHKAKEALEKHEDLLVGENFQEMFQALRLAVLDMDLTENADFTANTKLYLDANPAYAVGIATVSRIEPKEEVYKVRATYKAETDEYIAEMWSKKSNRWFPAAKKTGHARIPAFVKAVTDKMLAVHGFEGEALLGSRRTVEDISPEFKTYQNESAERDRKALIEKGFMEATQVISSISQTIDRNLRLRFPNGGRTDTHRIERRFKDEVPEVITWNTIKLGETKVQLATTVRINAFNGAVQPRVTGYYGPANGAALSNPVAADNAVAYIDAAVDAVATFVLPDANVVRDLRRTLDDVVSEIRADYSGLILKPAPGGSNGDNKVLTRKYWVEYPGMQRGYIRLLVKSGAQDLEVIVNPLGGSPTDYHFTAPPSQAAAKIISYLKVPSTSTSASVPTPHIRDVLRELQGLTIKYPGTLGADVEAEINKVLTGAAPLITLNAKKIIPVVDPYQSDVRAIQDLAHSVQRQYKNGNAQVGNIILTQRVTFKYRAQIVNLLLTIPSKDARPPGPIDPNIDLAGSIGEYFARGSKGALPAKISSIIVSTEITVSRQDGRLARTIRTAGATTFENLVWISDVGAAFRDVYERERDTYGHREGYPGTIAAKSKYTVRAKEPMTQSEAFDFVRKDIDRNNKWDSDAYAVPVSKGTVLSTDKVTVTVTARDEKEALRQAKMRIYATGRFPPNADVVVSDLVVKKTAETPRTKTFEVTGTRKAVLTGKIEGWLFYGWAPE